VNIILIGAQGSGKGTQAKRLAQNLGIRHISSGDLFRKAVEVGTELGRKARVYLDRGELVPDDITVSTILHCIAETNTISDGVLLDGFPRTIAQAEALDRGLLNIHHYINCTVYLKVPREVLLHRLSGRYICRAAQHVYNCETNPPKVPGICDLDGSELYQRPDDQGPAVQKRLNIFFEETIRLLDYYQKQGKLVEVNGNQPIEQVQNALFEAIRHFVAKRD
jgi:adenylate kinase